MQVGLKAYLLWEENGRPEGGDFSEQAREVLAAALRSGQSIREVERAMRQVASSSSRPHRTALCPWRCMHRSQKPRWQRWLGPIASTP